MEDEKIIDAEVISETTRKKAFDVEGNKTSLAAFIIADVGADLCLSFYLSIIGLIMCIVAMVLVTGESQPDRNPFKIFNKITFVLSIIGMVIGGILTIILGLVIFVVI